MAQPRSHSLPPGGAKAPVKPDTSADFGLGQPFTEPRRPPGGELLKALTPPEGAPAGAELSTDPLTEDLRAAIWEALRQVGVAPGGDAAAMLAEPTSQDLSAREVADLEFVDTSRIARVNRVLAELRMMELFAAPQRGGNRFEVAKLALGYMRHVDTCERDLMKMGARKDLSDTHLDSALVEMQKETVRFAMKYRKLDGAPDAE